MLAYFQNYFSIRLLCLRSHLKALTFALQSNQTDYNVHSVVAFFSFAIDELDERVDSWISAFLTPWQSLAAASRKQRVRSVENDVIKLTLKLRKKNVGEMYAAAAAGFVTDRKIKNLTSQVITFSQHRNPRHQKKKTRAQLQVQSETYES